MARNPLYSRDELILALDLYLRYSGRVPPAAEVSALSATLRRLRADDDPGNENFRNESGVLMKLGNFQAVDPAFREAGKSGLSRGNKSDRATWDELASDPARVRLLAAAIRAGMDALPSDSGDEDEIVEAPEGRILTRLHRSRERSAKLRSKKIAAARKKHGRVVCEVCTFDFSDRYGERGVDFMEVHHLLPLHELVAERSTTLNDLALVCANCHRMIHARKPWLTTEQLRRLLNAEVAKGPKADAAT